MHGVNFSWYDPHLNSFISVFILTAGLVVLVGYGRWSLPNAVSHSCGRFGDRSLFGDVARAQIGVCQDQGNPSTIHLLASHQGQMRNFETAPDNSALHDCPRPGHPHIDVHCSRYRMRARSAKTRNISYRNFVRCRVHARHTRPLQQRRPLPRLPPIQKVAGVEDFDTKESRKYALDFRSAAEQY